MNETTTLHEKIDQALTEHTAQNGGGIPLGYVACIAYINEEGKQVVSLCEMDGQMTTLSLGLTAYLQKTFELNVEAELTAVDCDCDDAWDNPNPGDE